jgi:type I restriction enzyme S subunit
MTDLPNGWTTQRLEDLCEPGKQAIVDGPFGSNLKRSDYVNEGIPVLKIQNIKENQIILKKMDYVNPKKYHDLARHSFSEGDIVMTKLGDPLGVSAIVTGIAKGLIVADLVRIRPSKVQTKFLCYQLNSPRIQKFINELQKGTTRPRVNLSMIRELPIYFPPLPEQHKIVEILEDHLSRLDAALADVKQAKVKAAQFRRSLLKAAFTGNLGTDGTRLMTSEKLIPFGKTFDILSNSGKSLKQKDYLSDGAFRVIDQGEKFIGGFTNRGDLVLDFGTPIIVFGDHTRNIKLVDGPFVPGADGTKLLRPKSEINFKFAFYQLKFKELRNRGYARHFSELKKETFWIPPLPEQHKIVEILEDHLSRLDASIALADAMEKQSAGLRRSLLQAAFTGQLTKEVASV